MRTEEVADGLCFQLPCDANRSQAHFSCVPQNGYATANTAVPRWHLDLRNRHPARHRNTINKFRNLRKPPRFGRRTALFPGERGDLTPEELRAPSNAC